MKWLDMWRRHIRCKPNKPKEMKWFEILYYRKMTISGFGIDIMNNIARIWAIFWANEFERLRIGRLILRGNDTVIVENRLSEVPEHEVECLHFHEIRRRMLPYKYTYSMSTADYKNI